MPKPSMLSAGRPTTKKEEMIKLLQQTDDETAAAEIPAPEPPPADTQPKPKAERKAAKITAAEPWKDLDNERKSRGTNLRMTEYELAQMQFIADNTEYSINGLLREAMLESIKKTLPAAQRRYAEKKGGMTH